MTSASTVITISKAIYANVGMRALFPGSVLVDDLPVLDRLPQCLVGPRLRDSMKCGTARHSVTRENLLELDQSSPAELEEAEWVVAEVSGSFFIRCPSLGPYHLDILLPKTVSALASPFIALALYLRLAETRTS
ncbi:hypothetical protein BV25DRAFT_1410657 [Artomyces pyxidatus]|uniref:Uncharacterized protein n=1 Tax=Artomyces pyxidatus TaxID=48021 RepID=A0ACB8TDY0_9AGAM|nr:hypothetical protein BV25DRAFT_1410657 [Artomyces pyxidatus]